MQLSRGTVGSVGHHWRTKCALSGYHGGKGNGLLFPTAVEVVCDEVEEPVVSSVSMAVSPEDDGVDGAGDGNVNGADMVVAGDTREERRGTKVADGVVGLACS